MGEGQGWLGPAEAEGASGRLGEGDLLPVRDVVGGRVGALEGTVVEAGDKILGGGETRDEEEEEDEQKPCQGGGGCHRDGGAGEQAAQVKSIVSARMFMMFGLGVMGLFIWLLRIVVPSGWMYCCFLSVR